VGLVGFTLGMVLVRSWQAFIHSELTIEQRLIRLSLVGCVAFVLIAFFPNSATLPYMFVTNFFAGVGIGVVFPILLNHLIDFAPHDTAKFSALLMFCIIIGAQSAGLVVGYVSELLGVSIGYMTIAFAMIGFYISIMQLFRIHKKMHHAPN
jgi:MFS family permease